MFGKKTAFAALLAASALSIPVFAQSEAGKSDVAVQAVGSFEKSIIENGVQHSATNSGGVLGTYRYFFNRNHGVEFNYGYALNTQRYESAAFTGDTKAFSHEATAAYVVRLPLKRVTPFALAGAGGLVFDPKDSAGSVIARPAFVYGAGADIDLGKRVFFRAQYRGLVYNSPQFELSPVSAEILSHRAEPSAGFGFRF
jgi:opacity protein-like surface antigen